ncbi:hypothetical protein CS053_12755 [Rhodanobacter glycinis]|uniref:Uncharacterized protein n=1 Tax=Rhodanobacter glycinis TaxID=582702 RepID=A0A5B9DYX8_9GAMM|nr:DUF6348 family protein [Rhodanobacter glycinis]QEE25263.1 hypothetical protein CS053_12755 [Rhodanobacter glycinis]
MDSAALQKYLLRLFERHDVELEADEDGWLATDGDFPVVHAQWHEGTAGEPGRLDIDVVLSEERCIEESFAGHGTGKDACMNALHAFEQSAFHPLLAACWYVTDDRKMTITAWEFGVRTWDVFIGPFALHGADITDMEVLEQVPSAIKAALEREALTPELHWLRLMYRRTAEGEARCEVLLDNEPWATGTLVLTALAWPQEGDYSAHGFVVLDVRDY